jgi:hypothetical protein
MLGSQIIYSRLNTVLPARGEVKMMPSDYCKYGRKTRTTKGLIGFLIVQCQIPWAVLCQAADEECNLTKGGLT